MFYYVSIFLQAIYVRPNADLKPHKQPVGKSGDRAVGGSSWIGGAFNWKK